MSDAPSTKTKKTAKPPTTEPKVRKSKTLSIERIKEEINKLSPEGKVSILAHANDVIAKERERLQQQLAVLEPGTV